jgi:hypothetical protein
MGFLKIVSLGLGLGAFSQVVKAGIYPSDHFEYSAKLSQENFNSEITAAVDGGKTMFVRFIASEG